MNFSSLPQFPSGTEDRLPDRGPMPDRHSTEFAVGVLVAVTAAGLVLFWLVVFACLQSGVGGGIGALAG